MKILHLANYNSTNIGNGALIFGTERVLQEDLGGDVSFIAEPWDDYTLLGHRRFDSSFVNLINHKSDALLVGAAVMLNGRADFKNAGMRVDLPYDLWPGISKPICFYAISYRIWPNQRYHNLVQFQRTMDHVLNSPRILFSVRNDGSKAWLESLLGYSSDKIVPIPDPTLYVPTRDASHPELASGMVNVVISLNNEDEIYRFGGATRERAWQYLAPWVHEKQLLWAWRYVPGWEARKKRFLGSLARALERLSREWDLNLILCPHYFDDYRIIGEFVALCSRRLAYQLMVSSGILKVPQAPYFYDLYAKADVALSMRVHSMTPAIGLGTPCVALVSQPRMSAFMDDAGLQDFAVGIFDPDLEEKVYRLLSYCLSNREHVWCRLQAARSKMRERTAAFNQRVTSLFYS